jgi:hypothetical protein
MWKSETKGLHVPIKLIKVDVPLNPFFFLFFSDLPLNQKDNELPYFNVLNNFSKDVWKTLDALDGFRRFILHVATNARPITTLVSHVINIVI